MKWIFQSRNVIVEDDRCFNKKKRPKKKTISEKRHNKCFYSFSKKIRLYHALICIQIQFERCFSKINEKENIYMRIYANRS